MNKYIPDIEYIAGFGVRHEQQALPSEAEKKPLEWHSHFYDQVCSYEIQCIIPKYMPYIG